MNDRDDSPNEIIEDLLRRLPMAQASADLDRRIEKLVRPSRWRWAGPAWGFATGSLATACVMLAILARPAVHVNSTPVIATPPAQAQQPESVAMWVEPQQKVQELEGSIAGVPVHVEQVSYQYFLRQPGKPVAGVPQEMVVPGPVTVRPIDQY